jgi:hypothetical protein
MVVPRVRHFFEGPGLQGWHDTDSRILAHGTYNASVGCGYEIRYLKHKAKYTDTDWGWDYDLVLADEATRVKRLFVEAEAEIAPALTVWLTDLSTLQPAENIDSSLVNSPLDVYLACPEDFPHLWGD